MKNKRKLGNHYCNIKVTSCQNNSWWYKNLIGFEFFCLIVYRDKNNIVIDKFIGIKLTKTKEIKFRDFDLRDVMII